jgi:hypothetical protein
MVSLILGFLGFAGTCVGLAYQFWSGSRLVGGVLYATAVLSVFGAFAVPFSETLQSFIRARPDGQRIQISGPVNLPTILWSVNGVLIAGLLLTFLMQTKLNVFSGQLESENQKEKEVLLEQKEFLKSMSEWHSKLPDNFSSADADALKKGLRTIRDQHYQIYRVLNEHTNRLTNQLTDILKGAAWKEDQPPMVPPKNSVIPPGLNVHGCPNSFSYIAGAVLVHELWRANIKSILDENMYGGRCDQLVITLAESG